MSKPLPSVGAKPPGAPPGAPVGVQGPKPGDYNDAFVKLLITSIAMIILPIGSYFVTLDRFYGGNATYAGITAAVVANLVLGAYIIMALAEDRDDPAARQKKTQ